MADILAKARAGRTVLKRTTQPHGIKLPSLVLYMEWLAGENKRRVIDTEGAEHRLHDKVVESSYRLVTGGQAEELLNQHWPAQLDGEPSVPVTKAEAKPAPKPVEKPAAKPTAKAAPKKPEAKKADAKKPAAKAAAGKKR